ncbi:hypothetical protein L917_02166 [Phytophthora nicotianae]|uniref:Uncharacterized protein n=4 Tax=Phytophthora nicotianae TaxID=4792 RepID=W2QP52_PHYN3|nr:hypothetical protein PPTG_07199 [Phytophthora nicotianae INRA-310]ETI54918.1 hypothetical protein F443_02371 [Phytophthora nicotianae P1569]ETL48119.1 hypothetical protein L916_02230 [Phytophthora nicotianae]ETO83652.1 hypothetical protein F444_02367 [Phytophthora nicotianae P1976]KUF79015.1 hypothetical protein AM587_10005283 [Phytophthora nicotianae]ETM01224.1 hypothetical protein L917_02166 [Phytophthora nicotianae]
MGNKLASSGEQRVSRVSRFIKPTRRSQSPGGLMSPSSPSLQQPSHHKHKRRSRSQSEGVTSDCGTVISTTDSQLPRGSNSSEKAMTPSLPLDPTTEEEELSNSSSKRSENAADQARRIHEAEKILLEIAKEYAAKRAAGLVPTKPVPARTLLWEEMERRAQRARARVGRRGSCVFGRDSEEGPCGCTSYKKMKRLPDGRENGGGVCECCKHGAPWHRLTGGTMASGVTSMRSSLRSRRTNSRNSRSGSGLPQDSSLYSLGSDYYDEYDDEYDEDESEDDEDIANEVARPYGMMEDPTPPLVHTPSRSEGDALDRSSLFSNGDSFGLPPRLSSTSRHLDKLLSAIAKYRAMGLCEDEIELKIREDFPPTEHGGKSRASR